MAVTSAYFQSLIEALKLRDKVQASAAQLLSSISYDQLREHGKLIQAVDAKFLAIKETFGLEMIAEHLAGFKAWARTEDVRPDWTALEHYTVLCLQTSQPGPLPTVLP